MKPSDPYSGFIRVRVAGLYIENSKLLLVKLKSPITSEFIWTPPGGGVNFKETLSEALVREFEEETSLKVSIDHFHNTSELIKDSFHILEFYYVVKKIDGILKLGTDPEHSSEEQLLSDIGFFTKAEIQIMNVKPEFLKNINF